MRSTLPRQTKERVLAAASELFAERGFHGTKMRDIAARAGVNLAAGHYHYGSKKELYLEVLRAQFAEIRAELARRGAVAPQNGLRNLSRRAVVDLLQARIKTMFDLLLGPPPGVHGTLMQREMVDPSEALPVIVDEFIGPTSRELEDILAELAPEIDRRDLQSCVFSIVGQVVFYRFAMPGILRMFGWSTYPPPFVDYATGHVTEFSLGGLERLIGRTRSRTRHRRRDAAPRWRWAHVPARAEARP